MIGNFIGNEHLIEIILKEAENLSKDKGSIIAVSGATGFGKSLLLSTLITSFAESNSYNVSFAEGQAPVGNMNIGNLQALSVFIQLLENLVADTAHQNSKKKKLAIQIGLNALSAVPVLGDALYFYKETKRDLEKYSSGNKLNKNTEEILKKITEFTKKKPVILLIDDMHYADAESVKALEEYFLKVIEYLPILIIFTYKPEYMEVNIGPLQPFIKNYSNVGEIINIEISSISLNEVRKFAKLYFKSYKSNDEFEEWVFEHSYGNPGICAEYLRYFAEHTPFDRQGNLVTNFKGNEYLPSSVQAVFSQHISVLTDEEKNILSICSAEGLEFTAALVSRLLNMDILSTIKKLRSLQQKTGFIKSLGASDSYYGVKTTKYRFTQSFYHLFFRDLLEYEEDASIHGQIKSYLKEIFDASKSNDLKEQLAPYIAAHSSASGDNVTTQEMLLISAEAAKKAGNDEIIKNVFSGIVDFNIADMSELDEDSQNFIEKIKTSLSQAENISSPESANGNGNVDLLLDSSIVDFQMIRKSIINEYNAGNLEVALEKAEKYFAEYKSNMTDIQVAQLLCLMAKCHINAQKYERANGYLEEAEKIIKETPEQFTAFVVYNSLAQLKFAQHSLKSAENYLEKAVKTAIHLPQELKLLALANISLISKKSDTAKSEQFRNAVFKLSKELKFHTFSKEFEKVYIES